MSLYRLSGIKKIFGQRLVVDIPDFTFDDGCIYALLGANGAGKTTLLNILAFLHKPTSGTLFYRSERVGGSKKEFEKVRKEVVLVDQKPILFSTTVYKNLEFGLKIRKVPSQKREKLIKEALDLVGMGQFKQKMAAHLSGGETQRIALARALVLDPKVLLCDEPTANVDSANQKLIVELLRKINNEKAITIIFTTHDNNLANSLAQKTVFLSFGQIGKRQDDNVFCTPFLRNEAGNFYCILPGGRQLSLPPGAKECVRRGNTTCTINPWKIRIEKNGAILPEINRIIGKIVSIELGRSGVRIILDAGILLTSMLKERVYAEEKYLVGDDVYLSIQPADLKIISTEKSQRGNVIN